MEVAVIGAGAWGTTLAAVATVNGHAVLWAREREVVQAITERRENTWFLPDVHLPDRLAVTDDLTAAVAGAELVVVAVPSPYLGAVVAEAAPVIRPTAVVLSVTKGLDEGTGRRMTEVIADALRDHDPSTIGTLSGPTLAREVMAGHPAAACVAFPDEAVAATVQRRLATGRFRLYTGTDVIGCEIAGVFKNVVAIAAGVADGLGYGMNTTAALVSRGLAELSRLGVAMGGEAITFLGLAGVGDLTATCGSPLSRNHQLGTQLVEHSTLEDLQSARSVAEGANSARPLLELAGRCGVELPICEVVASLLAGSCTPLEAVERLMSRPPTAEHRPPLTPLR